MKFVEAVNFLMSGSCNAIWRKDWNSGFCLYYTDLADVFVLIGTHGRQKMEKVTFSPDDLLANDWHTVEISPITNKPMWGTSK